jgi:hypothetical protein
MPTLWTIYDHPLDAPQWYVARLHEAHLTESRPLGRWVFDRELARLRCRFEREGLSCIPRDLRDDPSIVESWI